MTMMSCSSMRHMLHHIDAQCCLVGDRYASVPMAARVTKWFKKTARANRTPGLGDDLVDSSIAHHSFPHAASVEYDSGPVLASALMETKSLSIMPPSRRLSSSNTYVSRGFTEVATITAMRTTDGDLFLISPLGAVFVALSFWWDLGLGRRGRLF